MFDIINSFILLYFGLNTNKLAYRDGIKNVRKSQQFVGTRPKTLYQGKNVYSNNFLPLVKRLVGINLY